MLLHHASDNNYFCPLLLFLKKAADGIGGLLARGSQKAAGVDNEEVRVFDLACGFVAGFEDKADHDLRVDEVARTAEASKVDFIPRIFQRFHNGLILLTLMILQNNLSKNFFYIPVANLLKLLH